MTWNGRSLAFVRQVSGHPAKYPDCSVAMDEMLVHHTDPPAIGAWCWYKSDTNPHGNVALYLDDAQVLGVHPNGGLPYVTNIFDPRLGNYFGWSDPNDQ